MRTSVYWVSKVFEVAAAIVVLAMMAHITADVVSKTVFNKPLPGTLPIVANYYMVAVVFLPLAFVELRRDSIVVDLFYSRFSPWMKHAATVFGTLCSIAFFLILAYQSYKNAVRAFSIGEFVDGTHLVVTWPSRFLLPASFAAVVLVLVMRLLHELRHGDGALTPPPGFGADGRDDGNH